MVIEVNSENEMKSFGESLGALLGGGEIIELAGDVGAGKTTLTKGIAKGMKVDEDVQSPSFTINRMYDGRDDLTLAHYDFYRLNDAGIMANELQETAGDPAVSTIVEWAEVVSNVLPTDRLTVRITSPTESTRHLEIMAGGDSSRKLMEQLT